ncbi:MAG: MBL fold metallo-hydrolase [Rhodothermales bacterium]|nr:MBL fold metallo-hydrolase [Rhodothermales bacterium]
MIRLALSALAIVGGSLMEAPGGPQVLQDADSDSLSILYLANEGVLIEADGNRILLDGLHRPYQPMYSSLPADVAMQLETATAPFDAVDLLLVSHRHRDHVHPESVVRYLRASPTTVLASSPQVVRETLAGASGLAERTTAVLPPAGETISRSFGDIEVEFLGLPHGGGRHRSVQNLGHVVSVAGRTVLHVGDAVIEPSTFRSLDLRSRDIDVALLPYWYLLDADGLRLVDEEIGAALVVAIHVPPDDVAEIENQIRQTLPEAIVFGRPLKSRVTLPAHS